MKMSRAWAMPNPDTFSIPPITDFVSRWLMDPEITTTGHPPVIVDPFARDSLWGTVRNDLNPDTRAQHHMDAHDFCVYLFGENTRADAVLFDPPYSPRQISEAYQSIGKAATTADTQNARLYKAVRTNLDRCLKPGGIALSFGWNSAGFGTTRGYEILEILLVAHGGAHNDTICVAERKLSARLETTEQHS